MLVNQLDSNDLVPLNADAARALHWGIGYMADQLSETLEWIDSRDVSQSYLYWRLPSKGKRILSQTRSIKSSGEKIVIYSSATRLTWAFIETLHTLAFKIATPMPFKTGNLVEDFLLYLAVHEAHTSIDEQGEYKKLAPHKVRELHSKLEDWAEWIIDMDLDGDTVELNIEEMFEGYKGVDDWFKPYSLDSYTNPLTWPDKHGFWHPNFEIDSLLKKVRPKRKKRS